MTRARPTRALSYSFPPIADRRAVVLILGSMPGRASLAAQQYYAHPRNAFWQVMGRVLGFDPAAPYAQRTRALRAARIALWDVLHSCHRPGSLDSRIDADTMIANDFGAFFRARPHVRTVLFNGGRAQSAWRSHVRPHLPALPLEYRGLPSTSPAHAARSLEQKLALWRSALLPILSAAGVSSVPPPP